MGRTSSTSGALLGATAAGPLFVTAFAAATLYAQLPRPIVVTGQEVAGYLTILPLSILFGFALSILPNLAGAKLMAWLADRSELAREPVVWSLAGAGAVAAAIFLSGGKVEGALVFALLVAGAGCARVCHHGYGPPPGH